MKYFNIYKDASSVFWNIPGKRGARPDQAIRHTARVRKGKKKPDENKKIYKEPAKDSYYIKCPELEAKKKKIIYMYLSGIRISEIGRVMGITEAAVRSRLKNYGIFAKGRHLDKGFDVQLSRPEKVAEIKKLLLQGKTIQEVAEALQCAEGTIRNIISSEGLYYYRIRSSII